MTTKSPKEGTRVATARPLTFVDVFAGCGGLSLGLLRAGFKGLFAVEKDVYAFETLSNNLMGQHHGLAFDWPAWLPHSALCVKTLLSDYRDFLSELAGKVDVLAGGPPCQGFSSAGRRDINDPRNSLMQEYLQLVSIIRPKVVLMENVRGFTVDFKSNPGEAAVNFSARLEAELGKHYHVFSRMLDASHYGVPQARQRFILLAVSREHSPSCPRDPFVILNEQKNRFLRGKGLMGETAASAALSDLELIRHGRTPSKDSPGFEEIICGEPKTAFQRYSRDGHTGRVTDTRLAKHRPEISLRFSEIITMCKAQGRLNVSLGRQMRETFGLRKQALRVLDPYQPAPTITSMPDDLLHYAEPRTLTVRENARLQSFPDWFEFSGKYTSGGNRRRTEIPRFTQVANAVPPLLGEVLGNTVNILLSSHPAEKLSATLTKARRPPIPLSR